MHLLLLSSAAAAARAIALTTATRIMPPRLSLAEAAAAAAGSGDYDDGGAATGTGGAGDKGSQAIVGSPIVAGAMNDRLRALTSSFASAIGKKLGYCIKDTETEWNAAFDFSKDTTFLTNCMKETNGASCPYV